MKNAQLNPEIEKPFPWMMELGINSVRVKLFLTHSTDSLLTDCFLFFSENEADPIILETQELDRQEELMKYLRSKEGHILVTNGVIGGSGKTTKLSNSQKKVRRVEHKDSSFNQDIAKDFDIFIDPNISINKIRDNPYSKHTLIIGKGGSGKTTILKKLLREQAENLFTDPKNKIPVLIQSQYFSLDLQSYYNFDEYCFYQLLKDSLLRYKPDWEIENDFIEDNLVKGNFLILFDDVDCLPIKTIHRLIDVLKYKYPEVELFLTSTKDENNLLRKSDKFQIFKIQPLSYFQIRDFLENRLESPAANELLEKLTEKELWTLTENPLLLNMLCDVYENLNRIPDSRGELFKDFVFQYEARVDSTSPSIFPNFIYYRKQLLEELAYLIFEESKEASIQCKSWIDYQKAIQKLTNSLEKKGFPFLDQLNSIIIELVDNHLIQLTSDGYLEFYHQHFQVYYLAEYLLDNFYTLTDQEITHNYLKYSIGKESLELFADLVDDKEMSNGGEIIAKPDEVKNFLIMGNTGSGKTLFLNLQLTALLNPSKENKGVVVDAKQNLISHLQANEIPTVILNCFDSRHYSLDLSSLITTEVDAFEFSYMIIPHYEEENAFFYNSARDCLQGVIVALLNTELELTLRLIVLVAKDADLAEKVIKAYHPRPQELEQCFVKKEVIFSTLAKELQNFTAIAAYWEYSQGTIDLNDWALSGDETLVLGLDYQHPQLSAALNKLITHFLFQTFQALPDSRKRRIWVFFDELTNAFDTLPKLPKALSFYRSKGISFTLVVQTYAQLVQKYKQTGAEIIFALCHHLGIFALDLKTADWITKLVEDFEGADLTGNWGENRTHSSSSDSNYSSTSSSGHNYSKKKRFSLVAQELTSASIPQTNPQNGLTGYFLSRNSSIEKVTYPWKFIEKNSLPGTLNPAQEQDYKNIIGNVSLTPLTQKEIETITTKKAKNKKLSLTNKHHW